MSFLQTWGRPGVGYLVLRHDNYDQQGWDLASRASLHVVKVTGRRDTGDGLGHWTEDPAFRGDLTNAVFWPAASRQIGGWSFAWSTELRTEGGKDVATGPAGGTSKKLSRNQNAIPKGSGGEADGRYQPKPVIIPLKDGAPGGDPNGPLTNLPPAVPNAQEAGDPNVLILGIGGSIGNFGGPGVGTGSGFAQFQGVRTDFGHSNFPSFSGVRTDFSGSSFPKWSDVVKKKS
jgi:hypothetical protein